MKYNEGSLVSCNSKVKIEEASVRNGTVVWDLGASGVVMDALGYLHLCTESEIYPYQEGLELPEDKKVE